VAKKIVNVIYKVDDGELKKVKTAIGSAEKETEALNKELLKTNTLVKTTGAQGTKSFLDFKNIVSSIGLAGLAYGLGQVAKKIFDLGVAQEQTNITFTTFLGSAEKAKKLIGDLTKFSIITPFTPEQVNNAAKTLLAFDIAAEDVIPTLKALGDVSSGTGKDLSEMAVIFGQIRSTGRLMGQDLLQLINAGFNPLQQISKTTGRSVRDLKADMEKGLITFEMVEGAFKDATSEGGLFFNLMEKQSESVGGKLSTIEGNIEEVGKKLFEANQGGVSDMTGGIAELTSNINELAGAINFVIENATRGPRWVFEFFQTVIEGAKEAGVETERLKKAELELQLALVEADLQSFETTRSHAEKVKLIERMVELRNQLGIKMPTTEDPLPWASEDKKKEAVGLVDALQKKIHDLNADIKKTQDSGDLGSGGRLILELKAAQEQLDTLLGKESSHEKEAEKLRKEALENTRKHLKQKYEERVKSAEEAAKRERENDKRSFEHWKYYKDLEAEKSREVEEEKIFWAEDAAARKREIDQAIAASAEQLGFALVDMLLQQSESETDAIRQKYDDQIALADDNERFRKELQIKRDRELDQARLREKEQDKKSAAVKIGIEGLVAVAKTFAQFGYPAGIIPALLMAGVTAVQIATVKKYKTGGWIEGPGTETSDSVPILASKNEFMVNAAAAKNSPLLLEAINDRKIDDKILKQASGGGSFSDRGIISEVRMLREEIKELRAPDIVERGRMLFRHQKRGANYWELVRAKSII
jgi:tape measure domain-containing protein